MSASTSAPPEDMGRRFIDAWLRAERGESAGETNVTFRDLETLLAALTPKRLRYVRHHQVPTIKALAAGFTGITRMSIGMWRS